MNDDEIEPYELTLPDGRTVFFEQYTFTPGYPGSYSQPPEPNEVNVEQAWWADGDTDVPVLGEELDEAELAWLHDGAAYDALLTFVENVEGERLHAEMVAGGYTDS